MNNALSCREKIIKFLLNYKNGDDHGVLGYHLAQGVEEAYPTVMHNIKKLLEDGIIIDVPYNDEHSKNVKCKYELQPFYYDENLYLELYNFLVPYLDAIRKSSAKPFDAKIALYTIFSEVLENSD